MILVTALLSACGHRVLIPSVTPYDGQPVIERPVVWREGALASDYNVEPQDVIELTVDDARSIAVSSPNSLILSRNATTVAFAIWVGHKYDYLNLQITGTDRYGNPNIVTRNLCFKDKGCPSSNSINLADKTSAIELANALSEIGLSARIVPKAPGYLKAGDMVNVNLSYNYRLTARPFKIAGEGFVQSVDITSTVDDSGYLRVPRLGFVLGSDNQRECDRHNPTCMSGGTGIPTWSLDRAAVANLEKNLARVRVVEGPRGASLPLWKVERCLNAITWEVLKDTIESEERRWCRSAGVDNRFLPNLNSTDWLEWQRYDLQIGPRTWHLTDVHGVSHELPYQYGLSVQEAVEINYQRLTGRAPVFEKSSVTLEPLFVTVVPVDGGPIVYGQLVAGKKTKTLENLGLLPSDRVFVTKLKPRPEPNF
jgi:hypothetical protein